LMTLAPQAAGLTAMTRSSTSKMLNKKLVFFMTLSLLLGLIWLETQRDALKVPHVT
jgi:hypothetical protein